MIWALSLLIFSPVFIKMEPRRRGHWRMSVPGVQLGHVSGALQLLCRGSEVPVADVVSDGVMEEDAVLRHHGDAPPHTAQVQATDLLVTDADGAALGAVESVEKRLLLYHVASDWSLHIM